MLELIFQFLNTVDNLLWEWVAAPVILLLGIYFTIQSGFVQVRRFPVAMSNFIVFLRSTVPGAGGVHPLKTFFASVGGCVGIGNVVAVCSAIQIGGPGALFWLWLAAGVGMIIKYTELFLGMKYRVTTPNGHHNGGPMYFLQHAYKWRWIPPLVAMLLCVYGIEIYLV